MRGRGNRYERLLDLIGKIYDAALDEKLWAEVSPAIAAAFDAPSSALQLRDAQNGAVELLSLTKNYDAASMAAYESHYGRSDPWVLAALKTQMSTAVTNEDIIDEAALERSEFYHDWCRPLGLFHLVGALLPIREGELAAVGIIRPREAERFDEADKALLAQFQPHLRRALQIRRRLQHAAIERQAAADVLERTATATLVTSRDGRVLYANREAEGLFHEGDGIRWVNGRIAANARIPSERLAALILGAVAAGHGGSPGGMLALERPDRLPLTVLVAPFRPARDGVGAAIPAAILFIREPEALTPDGAALQNLFGLTPAEATVASALAGGKPVADIAAVLGISLNTARTHIKSIFAKTNTRRQSQLVALLLHSVAVMALH